MSLSRASLTHADLSALVGCTITAADGVELVLEVVGDPWVWEGLRSFDLVLTSAADTSAAAGLQEVRLGELLLVLSLEPVARDCRFVHYEAAMTEPVDPYALAV